MKFSHFIIYPVTGLCMSTPCFNRDGTGWDIRHFYNVCHSTRRFCGSMSVRPGIYVGNPGTIPDNPCDEP